MKVFILNLLISYILSLYTSNSTTSKQLFNLTLYGSLKYNGNYPSLSILDISGLEDDAIYISYYIKRSGFKTKILNYEFTDVYPDEYFECTSQKQSSYASTTSTGKKTNKKITSIDLNFEIEKQNKKYLVLENLLYQGYEIEVNHHKHNPKTLMIILIVLFIVVWVSIASFAIYSVCKKRKQAKSKIIDFKKEEPSPLCPPNQPYDSTQANITQMQEQPSYIPPEVANSDAIGYSSGMGQQDGYSSGTGPQGYYSGMTVQPS
jgi:hypothetical protein